MMTNVVNGKFCIENTDKNYLVNKYLNSTAPITKSDKFVPISIEDVDILKHLYVNKKKGKNVDIGKLQKVKQYVTYDFKTGELTSNYKNIDFEVDENDNFKIVSNEDYKVKQIIVVNSKKNPNNAGKNKYEVYHESQPLQIYEYANFFKDKKSKTVAEKVPVEMSPDLIFDYFRNANAHAAIKFLILKIISFITSFPMVPL